MTVYRYSYIDDTGKRREDIIEADTREQAQDDLVMRSTAVLSLEENASKNGVKVRQQGKRRGKVSRRELIEFCIYLGTLSEAGVSLTSALSEFVNESQNEFFCHVISVLRDRVENGETLSTGMELFPKVFTREFIYLVRAGEQTGTIPSSFKELRGYLEWLERLNGDIKQATTYPAFITVTLACFILFLFSSVVPKITDILVDMRLELPLVTKIIIGISKGAMKTWHLWIAGGIALPLVMKIAIARSERFALLIDRYKLELPIFGGLLQLIIQARFTKNFAVLHRAGISVLDNLELSRGFVGNRLYAKALGDALAAIQEGKTLSTSLKESNLFSGLVIKMFAIGESAGNLEESLQHAADYYDEEVPRRIKRVFSVLEPLIIVVLIGIIGMVAMAIFLPILSISQGLQS
jgi:type II secretory pathway component PulF